MRLILALEHLQKHSVLHSLKLDKLLQYSRLVCHLKRDILLPQPIEETSDSLPPDILPPTIAEFLSGALDIPAKNMQESWDILKYFIWDCETVALTAKDYEVFGWIRGISTSSSIVPMGY
jgi:hypothetical protein